MRAPSAECALSTPRCLDRIYRLVDASTNYHPRRLPVAFEPGEKTQSYLVPRARIELANPYGRWILSPLRLPRQNLSLIDAADRGYGLDGHIHQHVRMVRLVVADSYHPSGTPAREHEIKGLLLVVGN